MRRRTLIFLAVLWLGLPAAAGAHRVGEGYIFLIAREAGLHGRVELLLGDIAQVVPLDGDGNGEITITEFEAQVDRVRQYVRNRVAIGRDGRDYELRFSGHGFYESSFGVFAQLPFTVIDSAPPPEIVEAEYTILFDAIPNHIGYLVIESNDRTGLEENEAIPSILFTPARPRFETDLTQPLTAATFFAFLEQGIWHIWIGIDHILFVVALVMVSPLRRRDHKWEAVSGFAPAFLNLVKIITLFTIAHTITLSLAALGLVSIPPRIVESIIALSVALAAVNNIYPIFSHWTWAMVFGFGLFHGLGFASVLAHLTAAREAIVRTMLGFNLGVEIGQLVVVAVAFPIVFVLRDRPIYTRVVLKAVSVGIAAIACVWFIQRAFE